MSSAQRRVETALKSLGLTPFLVTHDRDGAGVLRTHVVDEPKKGAAERLSNATGETCVIVRHSLRQMARARSIQALMRSFGPGDVLLDPTGVCARVKALAALAARLRTAFGERMTGVHFESRRRSVFVVLGRDSLVTSGTVAEYLSRAQAIAAEWRLAEAPDFDLTVFVGDGVPSGAQLVALDEKSVVNPAAARLRSVVRWAGAVLTGTLFGAGYQTASAAGPAVSQPNMTFSTAGGSGVVDLTGRIDLPVGLMGLQISGVVGNDGYVGTEGTLFTRDPNTGMAGLTASYEKLDDVYLTRVAAEAELYLGMVTLGAAAGREEGTNSAGAFGQVDVKLYATPDLVLKVGGEFSTDLSIARIEAEWRPALEAFPGLSIFADGEFTSDSRESVMVGLQYHFGEQSRTLLDRDRRDAVDTHLAGRRKLESAAGYVPIG